MLRSRENTRVVWQVPVFTDSMSRKLICKIHKQNKIYPGLFYLSHVCEDSLHFSFTESSSDHDGLATCSGRKHGSHTWWPTYSVRWSILSNNKSLMMYSIRLFVLVTTLIKFKEVNFLSNLQLLIPRLLNFLSSWSGFIQSKALLKSKKKLNYTLYR